MVKIFKAGKLVLVLQGRFAGHKALVLQSNETGSKDRPFPHSLVVGIARYPRKVHRRMNRKKVANRSRIQPFLKMYNHSHLLPTRYNIDLQKDIKGKVSVAEKSSKQLGLKIVKKVLQERYVEGKDKFFFKKLRF